MNHEIRPEATANVTFLLILYAQGILPFLMPLAVLLMEPPGRRKWVIAGLTTVGAGLCAYALYAVIAFPTTVSVSHSFAYTNQASETLGAASIYVIVTCGTLFVSSHRVVRWFGVLDVVGWFVTPMAKSYAVTSIWCAYAAFVSIIIYWQFSGRHIDIEHPDSTFRGLRPSLRGS